MVMCSAPAAGGCSIHELAGGEIPNIIEVFSSSARAWFVAMVISEGNGAVTVRFVDIGGTVWEKSVFREDPRLAAFGIHTGALPPPGFEPVPSRSRPGQLSYLDVAGQQKYGSLEVAWQAYLEQRVFSDTASEGGVAVQEDTHEVRLPAVGVLGDGRFVAASQPTTLNLAEAWGAQHRGPAPALPRHRPASSEGGAGAAVSSTAAWAVPVGAGRGTAAATVAAPATELAVAGPRVTALAARGARAFRTAAALGPGIAEGPVVHPAPHMAMQAVAPHPHIALEEATLPPGYKYMGTIAPYGAEKRPHASWEHQVPMRHCPSYSVGCP